MTPLPQVQQHPASVDAYIRQGWSLVPIPPGTKGPRTVGWNQRTSALKSQNDLPQGYGIGLAHAYSGTMALDIDNWDMTAATLAPHGIDLLALYNAPDAVIVDSGRAGHGKLLYAMPAPLPSKKINIAGITVYELRCATVSGLTVQDVLPPSIHPDTKQPYRWAGNGNWQRLPHIPQALLDLWQGMITADAARVLPNSTTINASWNEIRAAVEAIPADCNRDEWINVGMALQWAGAQTDQTDQALHIWNDWSKQSDTKYPGEREIMGQWGSFKATRSDGVRIGTLFKIANAHGWVRPPIDVSGMFAAIGAPAAPEMLEVSLRAPPPNMPVELWSPVLATRAQQVALSVGCDPIIPLWAGLSAACGVIDAQSRLELIQGFEVPPILWLMTIGEPGDYKTPGSQPMMGVLRDIEAEDRDRFAKAMIDYDYLEVAYSTSVKISNDFAATAEFLIPGAVPPPRLAKPIKPVLCEITVQDITSQKLVRVCAERPRGVLCFLDEMGSWVHKMIDKSSGEDRSAWVRAFEAGHYKMSRVGAGEIEAMNMSVSVYGNIQPKLFKEHLDALSRDGMIQRFIPAIPIQKLRAKGEPTPSWLSNEQQWNQTLRIIYALPPTTYKLGPDAFKVFREFQDWHRVKMHDERMLQSSYEFMTALGKLEGTVGRIALIMHVIEAPFSTHVAGDVMTRAIEIAKHYIIPAYRYTFNEICGADTFDRWVMEYIIYHYEKGTITSADIRAAGRRQLNGLPVWVADQKVMMGMQVLEQANWVIRTDDGSREMQRHASWAISQQLGVMFKDYRDARGRARQRQLNDIYSASKSPIPKAKGFENLDVE